MFVFKRYRRRDEEAKWHADLMPRSNTYSPVTKCFLFLLGYTFQAKRLNSLARQRPGPRRAVRVSEILGGGPDTLKFSQFLSFFFGESQEQIAFRVPVYAIFWDSHTAGERARDSGYPK